MERPLVTKRWRRFSEADLGKADWNESRKEPPAIPQGVSF
jgi:hypothetical protein